MVNLTLHEFHLSFKNGGALFQQRSQVVILLNKALGRASRSDRPASGSPRIKWEKRENGSSKVKELESYFTRPSGLHHRHPVIFVICLSARRSRTPLSGVSHPRNPEEGTRGRARPGLLNQNAAEVKAQEPAGQASGSPDLAHTTALLPQRAALGSPGTAAQNLLSFLKVALRLGHGTEHGRRPAPTGQLGPPRFRQGF